MDQKVITKSPRPNNWALKSYRKGVNDDYRGQRKRNLNDFGCLFIVSHEFFFSSSGNLEPRAVLTRCDTNLQIVLNTQKILTVMKALTKMFAKLSYLD